MIADLRLTIVYLIGYIGELLRSPSSFRLQPRKYVLNQFLHASLIGFLPVAAGYATTEIFSPKMQADWILLAHFAVIMIGYVGWEAVQFFRYGATLSDNVEDFAFVGTAATSAYLWEPAMMIPLALFLLTGYLWRREEVANLRAR